MQAWVVDRPGPVVDGPLRRIERELPEPAEPFQEKRLRSVTANTRSDGEEFLRIAVRLGVRATTVGYPMAQAQIALADLSEGRFSGAAVLNG